VDRLVFSLMYFKELLLPLSKPDFMLLLVMVLQVLLAGIGAGIAAGVAAGTAFIGSFGTMAMMNIEN
jgi:hypothetical protein